MADLPISGLPAASSLDGTELLPFVQGGVTTQATAQDIRDINAPLTASGITVGNGSITPTTPQGATLGTAEKPFRELYLQSGSISIESDTPGDPSAAISNFAGNVDIRAAGFSVSSGSTTPFEITQEGLTIIKTPTPQIGKAVVNVTSNPSSTIFPLAASTAGGVFQGTGGTVGPTILTLDNFNNTPAIAAGGLVIGRRFRGTPDAPTQALDGDQLTIFAGLPYNGGTIVSGSFSSMQFKALGDTTTSSAATSWELNLVPTGSNIPQKVIEAITDRVTISGSLDVSGSMTSSALISSQIRQNPNSVVDGVYSTALGGYGQALGDGSTTVGFSSVAVGSDSFAQGNGTIASSSYQAALGLWNTENNTKDLVVIGNGNPAPGGRSDLAHFTTSSLEIEGFISASTYYGDGSNLTGIVHPTGSLVKTAYGSFYSTQNQAGVADQIQVITHNVTDFASGVSVVSGSQITFAEAGIYTLISTMQYQETGGGVATITGWLRKNGVDVADSATDLKLKGNGDRDLYAINYFVSASAGDYVELCWSSNDVDTEILYIAPRTSPTRPAVPSVITTVNRVG